MGAIDRLDAGLISVSKVPGAAPRAMTGLVAFSIFGNILVLTFSAAMVKQEIAKEGILPFSLFFATGKITPWARFCNRSNQVVLDSMDLDNYLEDTPMTALALHWLSSIFMILVTAMLKPSTQYSFLITLYSYVNVAVMGLWIGSGLLYLKIDSFGLVWEQSDEILGVGGRILLQSKTDRRNLWTSLVVGSQRQCRDTDLDDFKLYRRGLTCL